MKKMILLAAAMMMLGAVTAKAQFGIVAGLTSTQSDIKSAANDVKNANLFHAGVTCKIGGNGLAVQPSLIYNMKGTSINDVNSGSKENLEYKTGYLELPIQVQLGIGLGDLARVFAFGEPYAAYAITNYSKDEQTGDFVADAKAISDKFTYGFGAGVGVEAFGLLQLTVRYVWDLGAAGFTLDDAKNTVVNTKCNGIKASLAILF